MAGSFMYREESWIRPVALNLSSLWVLLSLASVAPIFYKERKGWWGNYHLLRS